MLTLVETPTGQGNAKETTLDIKDEHTRSPELSESTARSVESPSAVMVASTASSVSIARMSGEGMVHECEGGTCECGQGAAAVLQRGATAARCDGGAVRQWR